MLHWPKKSLVMPFYYINFDQNGPPYSYFIDSLALFYFPSYILMRFTHYFAAYSFYCRHPSGLILQTSRWFHPCWWQGSNYLWNWSFFWKGKTLKCISVHLLFTHVNYALAHHTVLFQDISGLNPTRLVLKRARESRWTNNSMESILVSGFS